MRSKFRIVSVVSVMCAAACGGGESDGGVADTGGTSSGTEEGGAGSNTGGQTDGGASTGGSPGSSVEPPTSLPALTCASGEVAFEGTVGGESVSERLTLSGPAAGSTPLAGFSNGFLSVDIGDYTEGVPSPLVGGAIRFPDGSARAGEVWCIDEGSLLATGFRPAAALVGHVLGRCPGSSVSGSLYMCTDAGDDYCSDDGDIARRTLGGELRGTIVEPPAGGRTSLSSRVWTETTSDYGVVLFASVAPTESTPSAVTGVVVGQAEGPEPGAVYCIGGGEWSRYSDDFVWGADLAALTDISYLGSCKAAGPTDSLSACFGY